MKLTATTRAFIVGKEKGEYQGKPTYKVGIGQGVECGTVRCTEEVFSVVEPFKEYNLELTHNDQYNTTTITRVLPSAATASDATRVPNSTDKK